MSPLGLLGHLSPSTIGMLASPPKLPGVPTLAELRKRADEATSSLPSYADLRAGVLTSTSAGGSEQAGSRTETAPKLNKAPSVSVRAQSKPIPRVNLDRNAVANTDLVYLPGQPAGEPAGVQTQPGGGLWFSSLLGGSGREALTIPPPPSCAITDPNGQATQRGGDLSDIPGMQGQAHDQGRARLMKMRDGYGRLQGEIPGEQPRSGQGYSAFNSLPRISLLSLSLIYGIFGRWPRHEADEQVRNRLA